MLLAVSADECLEEESSLIQEAAPVKTTKRDVKPLAGLLESARGFLVNGATNDVLVFANQTLAAIRDQIIPALVDEAEADQQWLTNEHARFATVITTLQTANLNINQRNSEERTASSTHQTCRAEEHAACVNKRDCEMELYDLWEDWVVEENELREVHAQIDGHFCVAGANGTLHTFRVNSVPYMQAYLEKKQDCDTAESNYDNKVPLCDATNLALDQKSNECNGALTGANGLQGKACSLVKAIYDAQAAFHSEWSTLHASYQGVSDLVYNQTQDRYREFRTLKIVECLLGRTSQMNGRPCDEATDEATTVMTECESVGANLNICTEQPNLCITYTAPPSTPDPCADRVTAQDGVGLECIPAPVPWCGDNRWSGLELEVLALWNWPSPPYTSDNPGCNAGFRGSCPDPDDCDGVPQIIDTSYHTWVEPPASFQLVDWQLNPSHVDATAEAYSNHYMLGELGATVDGCQTDNTNSHDYEGDQTGQAIPYVEHRNQFHQAAVRCCSQQGDQCFTQIASVCYSSATYTQAQAICEGAGYRLCSHAEMSSGVCCNTGCWYNHFSVWVARDQEMSFGHWSNYEDPGDFQQGLHPGVTTTAAP